MPIKPKIYHIVHMDRLASIVATGALLCDTAIQQQPRPGTTIGMGHIKERRRTKPVKCRPGLKVGDCVPFYFCPRSVMLSKIHKAKGGHSELDYRGGQDPIIHLEADLHEAVQWAEDQERQWAFTLSNAGSGYFEDRCDLAQLHEIDWDAVQARNWSWTGKKGGKQAEFLMEHSFPWGLIRRVGVHSDNTAKLALDALQGTAHSPAVRVKRWWYY